MRAIDTNVLVRLVVEDDPQQTASAETFVRYGSWISSVVIAEAVWVLTTGYGFGAQKIAEAFETLLRRPQLSFQDAEAVANAFTLLRQKPALGFSDCLILELARKAGQLPLGTFDRRLGKENGAQKI